ncbi:hypothetical protein ABI_01250 [Asticcacaulis biprosthecium C19]|uniref:Uncharacterized protein n=1 Tax=Asticcacaulis biprosthecium C19 TaxID=715226 RepID=F4QHY4_9CAUL|nr:hypothetical protein ABI_01250 [Asticcacaulis biprosthecium C19]
MILLSRICKRRHTSANDHIKMNFGYALSAAAPALPRG